MIFSLYYNIKLSDHRKNKLETNYDLIITSSIRNLKE